MNVDRGRVLGFFDHLIRVYPFRTAFVLMLVPTAVGFLFLTLIAEDAHDTANQVERLVESDNRQLQEDILTRCRIGNSSRALTRDTFYAFIAELERVVLESGSTTGDTQRSFQRLRDAIPIPAEQDLDCNGDGELNAEDYADHETLQRR